MLHSQIQTHQDRLGKALALLAGGALFVWMFSLLIVGDDSTRLILGVAFVAGAVVLLRTSSEWRQGVYFFLVWLVFEDLIRKYTGNGTLMFFVKDAIIAVIYVAMLIAMCRRRLVVFKPPFILWLSIFFWIGALQVLNPNSPNILYGVLGLKLYFYYVPLMFAGYALLRSEEDLHKFLMANMCIALFVAGLGIVQSILGVSFLNPTDLDPDLQSLGHDVRYSPISHLEVQRGTSVYVSDGRYSQALVLFFILAFGAAGYLLMRTKRGRRLVFPALGVVTLATMMAGVRSSFVALLASAVVLMAAFVWGTSKRKDQGLRLAKAFRLALGFGAAALILMIWLYPEAISARWAVYTETLTPGAENSELGFRAWTYPVKAMTSVFSQPNWELGNGIGTVSLGTQYVSKFVGTPPPDLGSESGLGGLILEFGITGPILWALWSGSVLTCSWTVVKKLKQTALFPIGFAFFWYQAYILVFGFFYGLTFYQNYISNAYLWLSVGMLFRLPDLLAQQKAPQPLRHATATE